MTGIPHLIESPLVTKLGVQYLGGGDNGRPALTIKSSERPEAPSLPSSGFTRMPVRSSTGPDTKAGTRARGVVGGGGDSGGGPERNPTMILTRRGTMDDSRRLSNPPGLASKVNLLVSVRSHPSLFNYNAGATGDLRILCNTLKDELIDPNIITTVVTDCSETGEWLPDHRAKVNINIIPPTLKNLMFAIASAAAVLKLGGTCLIWFGGFGGLRPSLDGTLRRVLFMADPQEMITGPNLRAWLMDFHFSTTVQVCLDACQAGRFLGLAHYFNAEGRLIDSQPRSTATDGPRMVCIAACHPNEFAHIVRSSRGVQYGGLAWFLPLSVEKGLGRVLLKDIERQIMPELSDPDGAWIQRPHVEMSYRDEDATFSLASLPKPLFCAATPHRG
ncbi:hypothetical protein FRB96_000563 [Tulasnella sp. 330]|nr:hypothetical protein FRB96_000563 [Tulasnella sp. 330]